MAAALPETDSEDELPAGWEERATEDGKVYYANHSEEITQWKHPRTGKTKRVGGQLPYGWERMVAPDTGLILFVDHVKNKTSYTDPRLAFPVEDTKDGAPIRQRFDASTTALQVVHGKDLSDKTAVITGGNSGIGFETARTLALHGAHVVLACRNYCRASRAIDKIKEERPNARVEFLALDLASFASVYNFVEVFKIKRIRCDILVLNAGIFGCSYNQTADGLESIIQVNYLSNLYMLHLMESILMESQPCRVILVSSESHRFSELTSGNISEEKLCPSTPANFTSVYAYNISKLCCIMLAIELHKKYSAKGSITVNAVHPGNMISSNLSRNWWVYRILYAISRPFSKSLQQGAATTVYAATASELENVGGMYFNGCYACEPAEIAKDHSINTEVLKISWDIIHRGLQNTNCKVFAKNQSLFNTFDV